MNTLEGRCSPVYRQLEAYEESWKRDSDALKECWACEDTIAVGLSTCSLVERVDRAWRERIFRGTEDYCEEADSVHRALFELWLRVTDQVLVWAGQTGENYAVEGVDELRQAERRLREHLTHWQAPRLSQAVGLRDMTLSPAAAAELDRVVDQVKRNPPSMPARELKVEPPDFLLK